MDYTISKNNLHLINSYQVAKAYFKPILTNIKEGHPESDVWKKGMFEMQMEWAVHNFCYAIHFKREQTKDCDLNYPQKWWIRFAYIICGMLTWIFIR